MGFDKYLLSLSFPGIIQAGLPNLAIPLIARQYPPQLPLIAFLILFYLITDAFLNTFF